MAAGLRLALSLQSFRPVRDRLLDTVSKRVSQQHKRMKEAFKAGRRKNEYSCRRFVNGFGRSWPHGCS